MCMCAFACVSNSDSGDTENFADATNDGKNAIAKFYAIERMLTDILIENSNKKLDIQYSYYCFDFSDINMIFI